MKLHSKFCTSSYDVPNDVTKFQRRNIVHSKCLVNILFSSYNVPKLSYGPLT